MTVFSKPLQLFFNIKKPNKTISYSDNIFFIGSCFSDSIAEKMQQSKFKVMSNPLGITYNPISIKKTIQYFVANKNIEKESVFFHNELYKNWDLHSSFSACTKKELLTNTNKAIIDAHNFITKANFIFITLGTAFVYELNTTKQIVANCHKANANWFTKRLLSHNEITATLQEIVKAIKSINKKTEIYFTVSPVRHIRDGVVENNRSKALLFTAIHQICETEKVGYFPSFELINDVLRDYRFFTEDLVHPNQLAIDFVWENYAATFCTESTKKLIQRVEKIKTSIQHKSTRPNSEEHKKFMKNVMQKILEIEKEGINFELEKNSISVKL